MLLIFYFLIFLFFVSFVSCSFSSFSSTPRLFFQFPPLLSHHSPPAPRPPPSVCSKKPPQNPRTHCFQPFPAVSSRFQPTRPTRQIPPARTTPSNRRAPVSTHTCQVEHVSAKHLSSHFCCLSSHFRSLPSHVCCLSSHVRCRSLCFPLPSTALALRTPLPSSAA